MKYFTLQGRLNRWNYFLQILLPSLLAGIGFQMAGAGSPDAFAVGFLMAIFADIIAIFPSVRRLHDINASGWWFALSIVPIVNLFLGLFLLFIKGTEGDNHYGSDPLQTQEAQGKKKNVIQDTASSSVSSKPSQKTGTNKTKHRQSGAESFDPDEHEKKCPDCAEYIKLEARVCRYCGYRYSDEEVEQQIKERRQEVEGKDRKREVEEVSREKKDYYCQRTESEINPMAGGHTCPACRRSIRDDHHPPLEEVNEELAENRADEDEPADTDDLEAPPPEEIAARCGECHYPLRGNEEKCPSCQREVVWS